MLSGSLSVEFFVHIHDVIFIKCSAEKSIWWWWWWWVCLGVCITYCLAQHDVKSVDLPRSNETGVKGQLCLRGRLLMCDMMSCRWRHWEHRLNVNMRQRSTFNHHLQRRRLPQPRAGKNPRHHLHLQQQQQPPQRQWRQCVIVIKHQLNNYNSRCSSHRSTQHSK